MSNTWEHITVSEFVKIRAILDEERDEEDKMISLAALLLGVDEDTILSMPLEKAHKAFELVHGLDSKPQRSKIRKHYTLKGWSLDCIDSTKMTVAQWVDFQTYGKDMDKHMVEILSCALVPHGKKYNEGYDMEKLKKDLGDMPIGDALAVCFFFQRRWLKSMRRTLTFLVGWMRLKKGPEAKAERKRALELRRLVSAMLSSL